MSKETVPEADFIRLLEEHGMAETARRLGITQRAVCSRRVRAERHIGRQITLPNAKGAHPTRFNVSHPGRIELDIKDGIVLVGSDFHYWPGPPSVCHRAFVHLCKELKPKVVVANGDVVDLAAISRFPPIGWEKQPTVQEEIETAQERLGEIEFASGKAQKIWCLGNHDGRFETRLATVAPEYAKVHGIHLRDHFPLWEPCWSVWINDCVVKHRFKGGIHAVHNNTMWSGRSIITGHLHSAMVRPFSDYDGTRYGVDTGCIADSDHRAFQYLEDNARNWRSAFCVLTFTGGRLLMPELVLAWDDKHVQWRGELIQV